MNPRLRALSAALLATAALSLAALPASASTPAAPSKEQPVLETNSVAIAVMVPQGKLSPEQFAQFGRATMDQLQKDGLLTDSTVIVKDLSRASKIIYVSLGADGRPAIRVESPAPRRAHAGQIATAPRKTAAEFFAEEDARRVANGSDYAANPQVMTLDRNSINASTNTNNSNSPAPPVALPRQPGTN